MTNAFVQYVCPILGNILGMCMLMSPVPAVLEARRTQRLGALNTLPYPLTALNCFGWVAYGIVLHNLWIIPANVMGLCVGIWFTMQCLPLMDRKGQDMMIGIFSLSAVYFVVMGVVGVFAMDSAHRTQMWGVQCVVILLLYYAVPLSTMWEVIKARNAASIYPPLAVAALANGSLWTMYGLFATGDFNVWMPNMVGALLAVLQLGLRLRYGAHDHKAMPVVEGSAVSETGSQTGWRSYSAGRHLLAGHNKSSIALSDSSHMELSPPISAHTSFVPTRLGPPPEDTAPPVSQLCLDQQPLSAPGAAGTQTAA